SRAEWTRGGPYQSGGARRPAGARVRGQSGGALQPHHLVRSVARFRDDQQEGEHSSGGRDLLRQQASQRDAVRGRRRSPRRRWGFAALAAGMGRRRTDSDGGAESVADGG